MSHLVIAITGGDRQLMQSDTSTWFVQFHGKVSGPFTFEQLVKLAQKGRLTPTHRVSQDELDWQNASELVGLEFSAAPEALEDDGQIAVSCDCGQRFAVHRSYAGVMRACPKCGAKCAVPEAPAPVATTVEMIDAVCSCGQTFAIERRYADSGRLCPACGRLGTTSLVNRFYGSSKQPLALSIFRGLCLGGVVWSVLEAALLAWLILASLPQSPATLVAGLCIALLRMVACLYLFQGNSWAWFTFVLFAFGELALLAPGILMFLIEGQSWAWLPKIPLEACEQVLLAILGFNFPKAGVGLISLLIYLPLLGLGFASSSVRRFLR